MPAHIKSAMMPVSLQIPVAGGRMRLGTWQGIYLFEHRTAPHTRNVAVHFAQITLYDVVEFCYYPNTSGCPITVDK